MPATNTGGHRPRMESLPSLQLGAIAEATATDCPRCGRPLNQLLPVCLWCPKSEATGTKSRKSNQQYGPTRNPEVTPPCLLSEDCQHEASSTSVQVENGACLKQNRQDLPSLPSLDFRGTPLAPAFIEHDSVAQHHIRRVESDQVSMRLFSPIANHPEDKGVAMFQPSSPSSPFGSVEAGPSTSSSRGLRSRSRSLFSLTISSHSSTSQQATTSTTSSMMTKARLLTRRISSSTQLRTQPIPEHELSKGKQPLSDSSDHDAFEDHNRSLRRKKRFNAHIPVPPLPTYRIDKRLSKASLKNQPPIPIALDLNQSRPGTSDSSNTSSLNLTPTTPGETEQEEPPVSAQPTSILRKSDETVHPPASSPRSIMTSSPEQRRKTRDPAIRWSTEDSNNSERRGAGASSRSHHSLSSSPVSAHPLSTPPLPSPPAPLSPAQPVDTSPRTPGRVGHPSRPYYSAIRKHCMSSPAGSRPPSIDQGSSTRPTSSSGLINSHPPSSFNMPGMVNTPFSRRPLSLGALSPNPSPTGVSSIGSSAMGSAASLATKGMSVFDLEDETDLEGDTSEVEKKGGLKSSSLSRAFGKAVGSSSGHHSSQGSVGGGKKRRRWSSSLFSEGNSNSRDAVRAEGMGHRPASAGFGVGASMSGETELRMALALMQEREEEAQRKRAEDQARQLKEDGTQSEQLHEAVALPASTKERKYRFRQTVDFTGRPISSASSPGVEGDASGSRGQRSQEPHHGVLKKLKKGLKGFLKNSE